RLILYKRIANAKNTSDLDHLKVEMIDRFGLLPTETENLFKVTIIKLAAEKMGINKIKANSESGHFIFSKEPNIDPYKVIELISTRLHQFKLQGSERLNFKMEMDTVAARIEAINTILNKLDMNKQMEIS